MAHVQNLNSKEHEFIKLLEQTKLNCLRKIKDKNIAKIEGVVFEDMVYKEMRQAARGTYFQNRVQQTGSLTFPDIIIDDLYGVEVKATNGKWISTGNSVKENTRDKRAEKIFIFFGKFGEVADIKYRLYEECLFDIGVTHSPRYKIDMELIDGQSIFDKMMIPYESLRKEANIIEVIKGYYRQLLKEGEELWWIDPRTDAAVNPVIRVLSNFSAEEKAKFVTEVMILFPEIFGNSRMKFERAAAFLIKDYNAVSSHLRDTFSAGENVEFQFNGKTFLISRTLEKLHKNAKIIAETIESIAEDKLIFYWRINKLQEPRIDFWKRRLDEYGNTKIDGVKVSEIFEAGLA